MIAGSGSGGALLRQITRPHLRSIVPGTLLRANHQVMEALVPVVVGQAIDEAIGPGDASSLLLWLVLLAVTFAVLSASWFFGARLLDRAGLNAEHSMRVALARRVLDPAGIEEDRLPGELLTIATSDAERASWIVDVVATAAGAIAALVVATVVLLRISVPLGLLVILGSVPLLVLIEVLGRVIHRHSEHEQSQAAYAAGLATDFVSGLRVLKGFGGAPSAVERYRTASRLSLRATMRAARTQAFYDAASMLLPAAFLALVAYVGARLAADNQISIGDLIAALGLTQFLIGPMYRLAFVGSSLARSRASAARIAAVLNAKPVVSSPQRAKPLHEPGGDLSLLDVSHGPLHGMTLDIHSGELVGVLTPDQADGDALIDLLSRSADPASGEVRLDGFPLPMLPLAELRRRLLVSRHDAYLFTGSVAETVTSLATPGAAVPALAPAVEASALADVIATLPGGIEARISERGQSLSGGQRQRLSLARALAAESPILVLQEPTTAVDSVTESHIAQGIRALRSGRTTILVTSSPVLLATADRVIVIEGGQVTQTGSHRDLVTTSASYREAVLA